VTLETDGFGLKPFEKSIVTSSEKPALFEVISRNTTFPHMAAEGGNCARAECRLLSVERQATEPAGQEFWQHFPLRCLPNKFMTPSLHKWMVRVSCRQPFETVAISTPPVFPRCLYFFFYIILQWHAFRDLLLFFSGDGHHRRDGHSEVVRLDHPSSGCKSCVVNHNNGSGASW